ncbi:MAG: hypothetical protein AAGU15_08905 [Anaerolineaceae bacterium]
MSNYKTYGEWCAEIKPDDPRSEILNSWRQSAYEQNKRIAELERMIKTVDENLLEAGMSVDLYFGNDTPGVMADIIMSLRKRIAELEALIEHASKTQPATEIKKLENVNTTGDFAEITFKDGRTIGFYLGKVGDGEWRLWDVTRRFCVEGEK